jgi:hypothetical protein
MVLYTTRGDFNDLQHKVATLEQQVVQNGGPEFETDSDDESGDEVDGLNAADIQGIIDDGSDRDARSAVDN